MALSAHDRKSDAGPLCVRKEGPAYDLPIAVGVLAASEQIWSEALERATFISVTSRCASLRGLFLLRRRPFGHIMTVTQRRV